MAAEVIEESAAVLRNAGARFAYLHGSGASGQYRPDPDIGIAAYFGGQPPNAFHVVDEDRVLRLLAAPTRQSPRYAARASSCRQGIRPGATSYLGGLE